MKVVTIVAARMGSARLPGKHLMDLGGRPMIAHVLERAQAIQGVAEVVLGTTMGDDDNGLANFSESACGVRAFRYWPPWDVLARYAACARHHKADVVIRLTADCPLLDPALASLALDFHLRTRTADLTSIRAEFWLDGLDVEVMFMADLERARILATDPADREHVTPWLIRQGQLTVRPLDAECEALSRCPAGWRKWSVDTPEDLARVRAIVAHLPAESWGWQDTVEAALRAAAKDTAA